MSSIREIVHSGLWKNNPATVQILGLCPLLAVTNSIVNALGLGLATILVLVISNVTVSLIRNYVSNEIRIPVFVIVIAAAVTITELIIQAFFYDLYLTIGLFVALITTNCVIIARAEAFASKNSVSHALFDGLFMGLGFTTVLLLLGIMRELIGAGTLFANINLLLGESSRWLTTTVIPNYDGYLLAILPPGAFIGLGLIIAMKNIIDQRLKERSETVLQQTAT